MKEKLLALLHRRRTSLPGTAMSGYLIALRVLCAPKTYLSRTRSRNFSIVQVGTEKYLLNMRPGCEYLLGSLGSQSVAFNGTYCTCRLGWYRINRMGGYRRPRGHLARLLGSVHGPLSLVTAAFRSVFDLFFCFFVRLSRSGLTDKKKIRIDLEEARALALSTQVYSPRVLFGVVSKVCTTDRLQV